MLYINFYLILIFFFLFLKFYISINEEVYIGLILIFFLSIIINIINNIEYNMYIYQIFISFQEQFIEKVILSFTYFCNFFFLYFYYNLIYFIFIYILEKWKILLYNYFKIIEILSDFLLICGSSKNNLYYINNIYIFIYKGFIKFIQQIYLNIKNDLLVLFNLNILKYLYYNNYLLNIYNIYYYEIFFLSYSNLDYYLMENNIYISKYLENIKLQLKIFYLYIFEIVNNIEIDKFQYLNFLIKIYSLNYLQYQKFIIYEIINWNFLNQLSLYSDDNFSFVNLIIIKNSLIIF